ncbi:MAG TPA: hypothetical protein VHW23_27905 [Kofleriaceae bacterium]|nr:hypothetical protein [Kofleriaceae bacterium]
MRRLAHRVIAISSAGLAVCALVPALGQANGRPPMTNGVHFKPGDTAGVIVATTFGLLVSPDGCRFYWLCEDNIGFGGEFDPAYAVTGSGAVVAATFHGLRISRDGGCSFATVTSPAGGSGDLAGMYFDALDVSATGEICAGSSDTPPDNGVFCSTDDAVTFTARGGLPPAMWYRSVKFAPGDPNRLYASAYLIGGPDPDGGERSPTAHLFRSDDDGAHWTELPLAGVAYGSVPQIYVQAVSPSDHNLVFLQSLAAHPPLGDRLYRSLDGGASFTEVLATSDSLTGVVVHDASTVIAATQTGSFRSTDGGATFQPLSIPLACLGQRSDGAMFGCMSSFGGDGTALARSTDGVAWQPVARLQYLTGALACPTGTAEHDTCAGQWPSVAVQLGIMPAACATGPDGGAGAPSGDPGTPAHRSGCCDAGGSPTEPLVTGLVALSRLIAPRRRASRRR